MAFTLAPTYHHSRRRAAASFARHRDFDEAVRVSRVPRAMVEAWFAGDPEFQRLLAAARRRVWREAMRRFLDPLGLLQGEAAKKYARKVRQGQQRPRGFADPARARARGDAA